MTEPSRPAHRDVTAFDERAHSYESGWRGQLHREITTRTAALAAKSTGDPRRLLDVGCGTGQLLRRLATIFPDATELRGIDPAPAMTAVATAAAEDPRVSFDTGVAEGLPYPDGHFDLVLATTSFDHWVNQPVGIQQCARVLQTGGHFVLVDLFSVLLVPTLLTRRQDKARTRRRAERLLQAAGFTSLAWHHLYSPIIKAVIGVAP
jgi:ubiquinone/menaquinone biosynthesis C-methylase UbiE